MARGKQTCKILKEIRRQIAEANNIEFVTSECRYKGDCLGTCPKCEAEVRYLEEQLRSRQLMGKAVVLAGISAGALAMLAPVAAEAQSPDTSLPMGDIAIHVRADTFRVKGTVFEALPPDTVSTEPLIGATVVNLRTRQGAGTDIDGRFEIEAANGDSLKVSYIGFIPQTVCVDGDRDLFVALKADKTLLQGEMPVTRGYVAYRPEEIRGVLNLYITDEDKHPIPHDDITIERIIIDEDGDEDVEELLNFSYDETSDGPIGIWWDNFWELHDQDGNPLKEVNLRITAKGYEKPVTVKVKYPKHTDNKTIRFKHKNRK